jgi:CRISPR-associated endonuclease/helicase Cas3
MNASDRKSTEVNATAGAGVELLSHYQPTLRLGEHLAQVEAAADFLLAGHSPQTRQRRQETGQLLRVLVRCHDLGKGSPAFQRYIRDPPGYRGDPHAKEHSALSAALALLWARREKWPVLPALALAQAVAGHHGGFASLARLQERLRLDDDDLLVEQWQGLDRAALTPVTGLSLAGLEDDFEAGRRWLFNRQAVEDVLQALPLDEAVRFRVWSQFLFSLLLEADKAFLALREESLQIYLREQRPVLAPAWVERHLAGLPVTPLNPLRQQIRERLLEATQDEAPCSTLTLPTGVGKTLLAASWALRLREQLAGTADGIPPRIIIVLPYLSIIDQTEQEYRKLFGLDREGQAQSEWLMASHSLAQPQYELEGAALGQRYSAFFLDTWRSEVILTTFDQLLLALFSGRSRHLMRFHALLDALIILDEVQALPCKLWDLVDHSLRALTEEGRSRILLMSATQPALLTGARELAGNPEQVADIFSRFDRYRMTLRHRTDQDLDDFIAALLPRLADWVAAGQRVLLTLNTRASARLLWRAVQAELETVAVHLISADVTPRDRLAKIALIKTGQPCVVVSTQTVEAGVDIDLDVTLRDFAPLDALVQVAGRCNRNNRLGRQGGIVEVVSLRSAGGRKYAEMVYDRILLDATRQVLDGLETVAEEQVLALSRRYFALLRERKDLGQDLTEAFARWGELADIQRLLRDTPGKQIAFLVLTEEEQALRVGLEQALAVADPWERRAALKQLAAALQQRTVSVYARSDLHPEEFAEALGPFWLLRPGYYEAESGLDLQLDEDNPVCIF